MLLIFHKAMEMKKMSEFFEIFLDSFEYHCLIGNSAKAFDFESYSVFVLAVTKRNEVEEKDLGTKMMDVVFECVSERK